MHILIPIYVFVFGLLIGSFLNVVIFRLSQEDLSIVKPRSFCPQCKKTIVWFDNIPIFSYIFLRGKCRNCKLSIPLRYPLIELMIAVLALGLYVKFGVSLQWFEIFTFACILIAMAFIDLDTFFLPLSLIYMLAGTGIFFGIISPQTFWSRLIGCVIGFGFFASVLVISTFILRKTGRLTPEQTSMGWGDPMMLAGIGANMGFMKLPHVITLACVQGVIFGVAVIMWSSRQTSNTPDDLPRFALPFGPFLALGALETILFFGV